MGTMADDKGTGNGENSGGERWERRTVKTMNDNETV
jgi:hypothetical protein